MTRKTLDPNLASILDSIRATVGGEPAAPAPEPVAALPVNEPVNEPEADEAAEDQPVQRAGRSTRKAANVAQPVSAPSAGRTVEDFLAELIRPQVDAWLKANLPELIQKMAADEIARLTGRK